MSSKGYSEESAKKICGKLQARHEKKDFNPVDLVNKIKEIQKDDTLPFREVLKRAFSQTKGDFFSETERHSKARKEGHADFLTMDSLIELYDSIKENIQQHLDFIEEYGLTEDVTGLPSNLSLEGLEKVMQLEEGIKEAGQRALPQTPLPMWDNRPMTPVQSSFIKGAGAYKGSLLLEFHHDPGTIYSFPVQGQGSEFFQELLNAGSKGGYVWDKILGKPSIYGMAKGQFFSYNDNGTQKFYTTPGAQFVHKFGRPAHFAAGFNPVGYLDNNKELYENFAKAWKEEKEKLVEPPTSREPILVRKLEAQQRQRFGTIQELRALFERQAEQERTTGRRRDFTLEYVGNINDFLTEDMKLNLNNAELSFLLTMLETHPEAINEPVFAEITRSVVDKINGGMTGKNEELENSTIRILNEIKKKYGYKQRGRGWWGETERHSKAKKEGKADLVENFTLIPMGNINDTISIRETENYTRKRQFDPDDCIERTHRTFKIGKGKKGIGCKRKSTGKFEVQSILEPKQKADFEMNYVGNINDLLTEDFLTEDYKVNGYYAMRGNPPKKTWIRRHTRGEGTSIKEKERMRPLHPWEIQEQNTNRLSKMFGKNEYSAEIWMAGDIDDRGVDFDYRIYIADNVDYKRNAFNIAWANKALKELPLRFQDLARVCFYKNITDDPDSETNKEDIPTPYKKVGWDTKYKDVSAEISYIHRTIRIKAEVFGASSSMRHEVGHAVFWWALSEADKQRYKEIFERKEWHLRRKGQTGRYQANDINEFFAVQFERYYNKYFDTMFPETKTYFDYINNKYGGSVF